MPIPAAIELDLLSPIPLIFIKAQALRHSNRVKICRINFILLGSPSLIIVKAIWLVAENVQGLQSELPDLYPGFVLIY